jgi:hypothetical protein
MVRRSTSKARTSRLARPGSPRYGGTLNVRLLFTSIWSDRLEDWEGDSAEDENLYPSTEIRRVLEGRGTNYGSISARLVSTRHPSDSGSLTIWLRADDAIVATIKMQSVWPVGAGTQTEASAEIKDFAELLDFGARVQAGLFAHHSARTIFHNEEFKRSAVPLIKLASAIQARIEELPHPDPGRIVTGDFTLGPNEYVRILQSILRFTARRYFRLESPTARQFLAETDARRFVDLWMRHSYKLVEELLARDSEVTESLLQFVQDWIVPVPWMLGEPFGSWDHHIDPHVYKALTKLEYVLVEDAPPSRGGIPDTANMASVLAPICGITRWQPELGWPQR